MQSCVVRYFIRYSIVFDHPATQIDYFIIACVFQNNQFIAVSTVYNGNGAFS
jgi:hypothetical protein